MRDIRSVAVAVVDGVAAFELGVACEVFGTDRTADGFPGYDFQVCSVDGGPVRSSSGFGITPHTDVSAVPGADLVILPAHPYGTTAPPAMVDALRAAHDAGAWLLSICSGAFLLGQAGLLDGRRCTTH